MASSIELAALEPKISELVSASMKQDNVPGISVGIVRGDSLEGYLSFGTQTISEDKPPTKQTISRVASITKTFTGTAILQLRDLGQLELDDPLLVHMPDFTIANALRGTLEGVTLRRLMTHYSGLRTEHPLTDWNAPSFPTSEELLDNLSDIDVVIPQDSQWKYSNLAVGLLGQIVEQISGIPYERYIYEEITGPLGLTNTRFQLDAAQAELKATGYSHPLPGTTDLRVAPYASLRGISAAGQLHSNVEDLAKWMSFQFSSGRTTHSSQVLSSSTLAEMHRPVYMSNDWSNGQALSWRMNRRDDLVLHSHGGGIQGYASNMVFSVLAQTGVVVLANIWPAPTPYALAEDIAELVIRELGPIVELNETNLVTVSEEDSAAFVGRYWAEPGAYVDVVYNENGFSLGSPRDGDYTLHGPAGLASDPSVADANSFRTVGGRGAGELAEFSTTESGKAESFRLGGFLYKRVD